MMEALNVYNKIYGQHKSIISITMAKAKGNHLIFNLYELYCLLTVLKLTLNNLHAYNYY